MRTFVLYARKAKTDGKFNINDLASAGRMDLVCRCVSACMFLSYKKRENTRMYVILNGPPKGPITLCFNKNSNFYPDEITIAKLIKGVLSKKIGKEWEERNSVLVAQKSFQKLIEELEGNLYVLHEKGKEVKNIKDNPIFILGDNLGIPKNEEKRVLTKGEKISIGKQKYLASSCISVLNWLCDQYEIN